MIRSVQSPCLANVYSDEIPVPNSLYVNTCISNRKSAGLQVSSGVSKKVSKTLIYVGKYEKRKHNHKGF